MAGVNEMEWITYYFIVCGSIVNLIGALAVIAFSGMWAIDYYLKFTGLRKPFLEWYRQKLMAKKGQKSVLG